MKYTVGEKILNLQQILVKMTFFKRMVSNMKNKIKWDSFMNFTNPTI
jgi:hypothetical protein